MKILSALIMTINICVHATTAVAEISNTSFPSIYGGKIETKQWAGKPYIGFGVGGGGWGVHGEGGIGRKGGGYCP